MSILNQNCQGLGNHRIVHDLKRVLQDEAPKVVFLMETKLPKEMMNFLKHEFGYTQGLAVSSDGQSGGLALLWKPESKLEVRRLSRWYIDAQIDYDNMGEVQRLTCFYGQPDTSKRQETWSILESFKTHNQHPWLCIGDFNEITGSNEKKGGNLRLARQMDRFKMIINLCVFMIQVLCVHHLLGQKIIGRKGEYGFGWIVHQQIMNGQQSSQALNYTIFPCLLLTILYLFYIFHRRDNKLKRGGSYFALRQDGSEILGVMKLSRKLGMMAYLSQVVVSLRTAWRVVEIDLFLGISSNLAMLEGRQLSYKKRLQWLELQNGDTMNGEIEEVQHALNG